MEILHQEYEKVEVVRAEAAGMSGEEHEKRPLGFTLSVCKTTM